MCGGDSHPQRARADAELKERIQLDGLSVDAGRHGLVGVHLERRCRPLLHTQRVSDRPVARRSSRRKRGNAEQAAV
jgi:hypothetical protein